MAHMACFNVTEYEKQLATTLDIPIYGCDPALLPLGSKSGSRQLFTKLGLLTPNGFENLKNEHDLAGALCALKKNNILLRKAVIKMNEGFSGEGNAIFYYKDISGAEENAEDLVKQMLSGYLKIVAEHVSYEQYMEKFKTLGGIAEEFIEGDIKESPSVQCRINPIGECDIISTHDQVLGGESSQVFLGGTFPAKKEYNLEIATIGMSIAKELQMQGVLGRFSIDFISVKNKSGWDHYAIEINLRKGGTTHPFLMLQFLTGGEFIWEQCRFRMPNGGERFYFASDNLVNEKYKGLTPHDLIDIAMCNGIQYNSARQTGVMFHMVSALSQYGKIGIVCIGKTISEAMKFYHKTVEMLDYECRSSTGT